MKLHDLTEKEFIKVFGGVYEHSPWVAKAAFPLLAQSPDCTSATCLASLMSKVMRAASYEQRLELIRAHPDLAGKAALAGSLTEASRSEQKGAGLDQCSKTELSEFTRLNTAYTKRFGFPFIIAVKGHNRSSILQAMASRLQNMPEDEFAEALNQIDLIAGFRIEEIIQ